MAKCENCYHAEICKNYPNTGLPPKMRQELVNKGCEHYKDKSLIIELPCKEILAKIGDSMYFITDETDEVIETMVSVIEIDCDGQEWIETVADADDEICSYIYFRFSELGKTLFLTHDEAERALKEREKNGNEMRQMHT